MGRTFYVTTPIYYVNDVPHIGHAYTTILADVVARYRRALGQEVFLLTGLDEHGQKVEEAAKKRGKTPQEHCDEMAERWREVWKALSISHDDFVRTTEARHEGVVQAVLQDLWNKGEIYVADYEGWYSTAEEVFVTETEIEEKALDRTKLKRISERNYFFRMGRRRDQLRAHIAANPGFVTPDFRRNEVVGFLKGELSDLCISRPKSRLAWGIPLPFDPDYVTYVWFDALLNYASVPGLHTDIVKFARLWPPDLQLMGKDILTTHAVYWTTMLLSMKVELPRRLLAHGWWTTRGDKMSKSVGNVLDPLVLAGHYGPDVLRYFLMRDMVVGQDAEFAEERFHSRYETDLGNEFGNLLSRVVTMIGKFCEGRIPIPASPGGGASETRDAAKALEKSLPGLVDEVAVHRICEGAMAVLRAGNRHVDATQPWKAAKEPAREGEVRDALYTIAEGVRIAAAALQPILPQKCVKALCQLGAPPAGDLRTALDWGGLVPGAQTVKADVLFPRREATTPAAPDPA
jgi:methionyl-tRNA synthetase